MSHPLYLTPEEAEYLLRKFGQRVPTAEAIRLEAKTHKENLGFPVSVFGTRIYIPRRSFLAYWGITEAQAAAVMATEERSA